MIARGDRWDRDQLVCLGVLALLLYVTARIYVTGGLATFAFAYDDAHGLPRAVAQYAWWEVWGSGDRYPLTTWTFDRQAGQSAGAYHVANLGLHLLNGLLLIGLLARTVHGLRLTPTALVTGAVFLLHPLQVATVAHVSGRSDLLVGLGWLVAAHSLLLAGRRAGVVGVVGALIMVTAKPTGGLGLIPLALVAWAVDARAWRAWVGVAVGTTVGLGVAAEVVAINSHGATLGDLIRATGRELSPLTWWATQVTSVSVYVTQVVVPWPLVADPNWIADQPAWWVEGTVAAVSVTMVALRQSAPARVLGAWTLACVGWRVLVPHSEVFGGVGDGYLWLMGVSVGAALGVEAGWGAVWTTSET